MPLLFNVISMWFKPLFMSHLHSKMEEVLVLLDRYWPKISWRNRPFWIALTLCLVIFLVVNIFTYLNGYSNSHVDTAEKAMVQGKKKIFGLNVAAQPKNPTTE